jgi:hypothetical protein
VLALEHQGPSAPHSGSSASTLHAGLQINHPSDRQDGLDALSGHSLLSFVSGELPWSRSILPHPQQAGLVLPSQVARSLGLYPSFLP